MPKTRPEELSEGDRLRRRYLAAVEELLTWIREHPKSWKAATELQQAVVDAKEAATAYYRAHPEEAAPPFSVTKAKKAGTDVDVVDIAMLIKHAPDVLRLPGVVLAVEVEKVKTLGSEGVISTRAMKQILTHIPREEGPRVSGPEALLGLKMPKK